MGQYKYCEFIAVARPLGRTTRLKIPDSAELSPTQQALVNLLEVASNLSATACAGNATVEHDLKRFFSSHRKQHLAQASLRAA